MAQSNQQNRRQIVAGAADMIRRRGLNATSVRGLAKHAQAPLGSTYHYFPGGKQQLATEAVQFAGEVVSSRLREELQAGPAEGVRAFLAYWREVVTSTGFKAGCPVLAVSVEEPDRDESSTAVSAAADAFGTWVSLLAASLRQHGAAEGEAEQLAVLVVAAVEGAIALCRAQRSALPLDHVAARLEALVEASVTGS